jgi:hypothetical protein
MSLIKLCGKEFRVQGRGVRIACLEGDKYKFAESPEDLIANLRGSRKGFDIFTFMQPLSDTTPKFPYSMEWDNLAVLPVSTFDHWWTQQIGFKARNKAKQAEKKGVTVREAPFDDAFIRGIWEIYNETPVRQGRPFAHYGMDLEAVRKYAETFLDTSVFIGAYVGDTMIGFVKLTMDDTGTQAGLMHILSMVQHRDKAPTNALMAQAVRSCAERKVSYLVYSNFAYGKKQTSSLSDFKERNGFKRVDVPRYYVPLTLTGRVALRLGMHKRFIDRIPEPILAKIRELRNGWYNRNAVQSAAEAS